MQFLLTNDVESFSIASNRCDRETAHKVYKVGLPRLLDLYSRHDVASTFYFTGEIAEIVPEAIDLVKSHGHEIGCHGYSHEINRAFDLLSYAEQVEELLKAKKAIEPVAGKICSFRAPALRINEETIRALEATGFTTDSSICPQRFDGPFTFGSKRKLAWLVSRRRPFYQKDSRILEIPISAALIPYIGTTMRISPSMTRVVERVLFMESKRTGKPIVFLFHPNECIEAGQKIIATRRSSNIIGYVFADVLRQRLKLSNLGKPAVALLDRIITKAKGEGFEFMTSSEYARSHKQRSEAA
jgi:peptidoglycan-N-acetylglucosamine deacetylase